MIARNDSVCPWWMDAVSLGRPMSEEYDVNQRLPQVVEALSRSVTAEPKLQHLDRVLLPSRDAIIHAIKLLRQLVYPGYFGHQQLTTQNLPFRLGELVIELDQLLYQQVRCCLRYREHIPGDSGDDE